MQIYNPVYQKKSLETLENLRKTLENLRKTLENLRKTLENEENSDYSHGDQPSAPESMFDNV
ncbi:MAG: hypothetical protein BWY72_01739 [Bacteroidetes bacterium ADurb.Bin416]|nr:MAG: hypothetical protein BWY72_01739 [Bacteroidetes bacterium ADurb.Bin416]